MIVDQCIKDHRLHALIPEQLNILCLLLFIADIENLVLMPVPVPVEIVLQGRVIAIDRPENDYVLNTFEELLFTHASEFHERVYVIPVPVVVISLVLIQRRQLVGNLLGNVCRYFLYVSVVLEETPRYVQRQVRAIDHALEQHQELRDDFLDVVCHKNLVVIKLDLPFYSVEFVPEFREIQYTLEIERVVHVQVYPEQRIIIIMENLPVKFLVLLFGAIFRQFEPERVRIVDGFFLFFAGLAFSFHVRIFTGGRPASVRRTCVSFGFPVSPGFLRTVPQVNSIRHEAAVFFQDAPHFIIIEEFKGVVGQVERYRRAPFRAVGIVHFIFRAACACPSYGTCPRLP